MASGILTIAILVFAIRGYFLSLPGVVARLIGLLCAYFVAFGFRADVAAMLATRAAPDLHPWVLQAISGAVLFFGTLFFVSFSILGMFKLLNRLLPALRAILSREAVASRIGGATLNASVGAVLVLVGLWVYGFTLGKNTAPDDLQRFANRFGDRAFALTRRLLEPEVKDHGAQSLTDSAPGNTKSTEPATVRPIESEEEGEVLTPIVKGTAEIRSVENPDKHLFIERYSVDKPPPKPEPLDLFGDGPTPEQPQSPDDGQSALEKLIGATDLEALLKRKDVQEIAGDPAVRKKALEILQSNPEMLQDAAKNPKYRALLKQLQQSKE